MSKQVNGDPAKDDFLEKATDDFYDLAVKVSRRDPANLLHNADKRLSKHVRKKLAFVSALVSFMVHRADETVEIRKKQSSKWRASDGQD